MAPILTLRTNCIAFTSLFLLIANFYSLKSMAQDKLIRGIIYDDNKNPLPWVNIGIRNKNIGRASTDKGTFELKIPADFKNDTLIFSAVGFQETNLPIKTCNEGEEHIIVLRKSIQTLKEVIITNKKRKRINLGTTGFTPLIWLSLNVTKHKGNYAELGQLIKIKHPSQLLTVKARVAGNKKNEDSTTYRLNIYKVENGLPGARIIEKEIMKSFLMSDKEIRFDLKKELIFLEEDCIIAFEYIPKKDILKSPILSFRASATGTGGFSRMANIGNWAPINGGSGSISVEVEQ